MDKTRELPDDRVHHGQHLLGVPGAQGNQNNRKQLAHDCFLFQAGRLTGFLAAAQTHGEANDGPAKKRIPPVSHCARIPTTVTWPDGAI